MNALTALAKAIDRFSLITGRVISWLALGMVLMQFVVVILRYVFGFNFIWMQEAVVYMHGLVFMIGAAYTLLEYGHVRVDVFYRDATPRFRALVDLAGAWIFMIPVSVLIFWVSMGYVGSSWAIFEGSPETTGIPAIFLLKTVILVFASMMIAQAVAMSLHAVVTLKTPQEATE